MAVAALLLLLIPVLELFVLVKVSAVIGAVPALLLMICLTAAGAWVVKREGLGAWRRVQVGLRAGRVPTTDVVDGFMLLLAGALLLIPGFLTDVVGFALLVPPLRRVAGGFAAERLRRRVARRVRVVGRRLGPDEPIRTSTFGPAYRRADDPFGAGPPRRGPDDDVIDVEGEEIVFPQAGPQGELPAVGS